MLYLSHFFAAFRQRSEGTNLNRWLHLTFSFSFAIYDVYIHFIYIQRKEFPCGIKGMQDRISSLQRKGLTTSRHKDSKVNRERTFHL
jgi:hypothetical protein